MTNLFEVTLNPISAERSAVPAFLKGLDVSTLQNLDTVLKPAVIQELGVLNIAYWPGVRTSQTLAWNEKFGDEILTPDAGSKTVLISHAIIPKSVEDIQADRDRLKLQVYVILDQKESGDMLLGDGSLVSVTKALALTDKATKKREAKRKNVAKNGRYSEVTPEEADAIELSVDQFLQSLRDRAYDLYSEIDSADTQEKWDAIDIHSGWPSLS